MLLLPGCGGETSSNGAAETTQASIVFASDYDNPDGAIYIMNDDGSERRVVSAEEGGQVILDGIDPAWSPDRRKIAFSAIPGDIYVMEADGSGREQLTQDIDNEEEPAWSPDGDEIAFTRRSVPRADIYVIKVDGSGQRKLPKPTANASVYEADWSPDGTRVAFVGEVGELGDINGEVDIFVTNADGSGGHKRLTQDADAGSPVWSPDGTRILFTRGFGKSHLYVMNADGSGQQRLTNTATEIDDPVWSPDGSRLAYASLGDIFVMDVAGGNAKRVTTGDGGNWAPDW